jgi:hypothetical protein
VRLPPPSPEYNRQIENIRNGILEREDQRNLKIGSPVTLVAPDGSKWLLVVDNSGNLSAEAL